eukprot:TRINITY_DN12761_c0_g1_i1.p1 TRINITY_DN12761_c0_g1~~TRINITY_DN12761_c0_g1_i1.p1  ORF type:complete len:265 (+),score=121.98 TRINITY_DN12761_c0_g1_i1:50-796(+)
MDPQHAAESLRRGITFLDHLHPSTENASIKNFEARLSQAFSLNMTPENWELVQRSNCAGSTGGDSSLIDFVFEPRGFVTTIATALTLFLIYTRTNPIALLFNNWTSLLQVGILSVLLFSNNKITRSSRSKTILYGASIILQLYSYIRNSVAAGQGVSIFGLIGTVALGPLLPILRWFMSLFSAQFLRTLFLYSLPLLVKRVAIFSFLSIALVSAVLILLVYIGDRVNNDLEEDKRSFVQLSYEKQFEK